MKYCFLFPGQGAQYPGMGKDLFDASPAVRRMFHEASAATGFDLERLLFSGTAHDLMRTDVTQVAVTLVDLAAWQVLSERGIDASGCAGFSLGEYPALVASGVLSANDVFPLVKVRGALSARAADGLASEGDAPGMSAIIGLTPETVSQAIADSNIPSVYAANLNSPKQTVIAGRSSALDAVEPILKSAGARRVIRLKVSGAFHTPLMTGVAREFEAALSQVAFADPRIPLYSNVTGKRVATGTEAKRLCVEQLTNPVRWIDVEQSLASDGYTQLLEVGPGTVLTGLWKAAPAAGEIGCLPAGGLSEMDDLPHG